jgi:hypothetical protein
VEVGGSIGYIGESTRFLTDIIGLQSQLRDLCIGTPGGSCDVTRDSSSNRKWDFGLTGGYAIWRNLVAIGEFSQTRALNPKRTFYTSYYDVVPTPCDPYYYDPSDTCYYLVPAPPRGPTKREFNTHVNQFTGGVQYQVPVTVWRLAPFVGVSAGVARATTSSKDSAVSDLSRSYSTVSLTAGARVYLSPTWGLRPELKVMRLFSGTNETGLFFSGVNETVVRTSIGVFYQFRP